uniref:Uncharacterized protein n=1 Tax=Tanacetum cinerariifolium TaxID=118510 RepID=A0A699IH13_TANCI|nr:hypothetical protein [Tanacetum cinerariifolium]
MGKQQQRVKKMAASGKCLKKKTFLFKSMNAELLSANSRCSFLLNVELGPDAKRGSKGSASRFPSLADPATQPFTEDKIPISTTNTRGR